MYKSIKLIIGLNYGEIVWVAQVNVQIYNDQYVLIRTEDKSCKDLMLKWLNFDVTVNERVLWLQTLFEMR